MLFDIYNRFLTYVDHVDATNAEDAIKHAKRVHGLVGPIVESRLAAQQRRERERNDIAYGDYAEVPHYGYS